MKQAYFSTFGLLLGVSLFVSPAAFAAEVDGTASAPAGAFAVPAAGSCAPAGGLKGQPGAPAEDAAPGLPFATGEALGIDRLQVLKNFLPSFIWEYRERFFFDGMRLEVGPCFADYGPPDFYSQATEAGRGTAKLLGNGGLEGHGAGLPFAPDAIEPQDSMAGAKWLWNVAHRYQAAGFRGRFRMTDLVGRIGRAEPFEGDLFKLQLRHRADRGAPDYAAPKAKDKQFVAGGVFFEPFDAREYSWRQFRSVENQTDEDRSDDLHAYLPQWRRVRRISSTGVEGIYLPSFSVGVAPTQSLALGATGDAAGVGAVIGGGGAAGTIQNKRSGYEGLEIRPLLYNVTVSGVHDVLAPINSVAASYPENPDRDFGPWGLSFASDRWDLRRALVLELTAKEKSGSELDDRQVMYVDLQTLNPLYIATYDTKGEMSNVGIYVGRWSEDRSDYPRWPDDSERAVRVIDSVAVAFANLAESGSWRRESWDNVGTPPSDAEVRRMISVGQLTKRR